MRRAPNRIIKPHVITSYSIHYTKLYEGVILLTGGASTALTSYIRHNLVEAFVIPSASLEPTLLVGDQILVDRHPEARFPTRGDLVVFDFPDDSGRVFVKRVVAIGGDRVEIRDKVLWLNGKPVA